MNVDTGQFRALAAEVGQLRADVDGLRRQVDAMDKAAAILAAAGEPRRAVTPSPRHARPRGHLRLVDGGR